MPLSINDALSIKSELDGIESKNTEKINNDINLGAATKSALVAEVKAARKQFDASFANVVTLYNKIENCDLQINPLRDQISREGPPPSADSSIYHPGTGSSYWLASERYAKEVVPLQAQLRSLEQEKTHLQGELNKSLTKCINQSQAAITALGKTSSKISDAIYVANQQAFEKFSKELDAKQPSPKTPSPKTPSASPSPPPTPTKFDAMKAEFYSYKNKYDSGQMTRETYMKKIADIVNNYANNILSAGKENSIVKNTEPHRFATLVLAEQQKLISVTKNMETGVQMNDPVATRPRSGRTH